MKKLNLFWKNKNDIIDIERYIFLPKFSEWVMLLRDKDKNRIKKSTLIFFGILIGCIFFACALWLASEKKWIGREILNLLSLACVIVMWGVWMSALLWDVWKGIKTLANPSRFLADELDRSVAKERVLIGKFRSVPKIVIKSQYDRLDAYISMWEKWLDTVRIFSLLGTGLLLLIKGDALNFPVIYKEYAEILVSSAVVGALVGALFIRVAIRDLQQVLYVLKTLSEGKDNFSSRKRSMTSAKK